VAATRPRKKTETDSDKDALAKFRAAWGEAEKPHAERCKQYERAYKGYHGERDPKAPPLETRSDLRPMYALQATELLVANLVEDRLEGKVTPKRPDKYIGAKGYQRLIEYQRRLDDRDEKVPLHVRQAVIYGVAPGKTYQKYQKGPKRVTTWIPSFDGLSFKSDSEVLENQVLCDHPSFEPWPVEDFLWDPTARRFDECAYVLARTYERVESLRKFEEAGVYRNVDQVATNTRNTGTEGRRAAGLLQVKTEGLVEVVEFWTRERLITVANQTVVLRDEPHLYDHGRLPFVLATIAPDVRNVAGVGMIAMIQDIITALWRNLNQRIDNAQQMLSAVIGYDPEQVPNPSEVFKTWSGVYVPKSSPTAWNYEQPPLSILESSIKLEEQMLATMRDICGVNAYVSGTSDQQIDQKTASGINLIQSAAAKRFQQIKNQIGLSLRRVGLDEIDLNQQFFNKAMAVPLMGLPADLPPGKSAADYFTTITPGRPDGSGIGGTDDFDYDIEDASESLNRQQRRMEADVRLDKALAVATLLLSDPSAPTRINVIEAYKDYLEAYDEPNPDRFLQQAPPPPPLMLGAPPPGGGGASSPATPATGSPGPGTPIGSGGRPSPPRPAPAPVAA
jgi:hypothetical protein